MEVLAYSASTGSRSQEHFGDVSVSSNLPLFLSGPSLTTLDGSFLPTCYNPLSGVLTLLSKEFGNLAFCSFLVEETEASSIAASSPEVACLTTSILWKIRENII